MAPVQPLLAGLVLALVFTCPVQGDCPSGWEQNDDSCYWFVAREMAWSTAEVNCVRRGARLVKVESDDENQYLRTYLSNNSRVFYGYDMWLGARKIGAGSWNWADGSDLQTDVYEDWSEGSPSNTDPNMCLEFDSGTDNHWNDDFCDELNYSICERPFTPLTPPPPAVG